MTTKLRLKSLLLVCALVAAGLMLSATDALASHFRYGTITWTVPNPAQPNVVNIRFDSVWRWSFPYSSASSCPAGFIVIPTGATTGPGGCPALGSTIGSLGTINILNSTNTTIQQYNLTPVVTSINSAEDWFSASFQVNNVTLPLANANYTAMFSSNARLSTLLGGNADQVFTVTSGITIRVPPAQINQPPTIGTLPIIVLARGQATTFQLAASDPNGEPLTFRISTPAESGLVQAAPTGLSMSPAGVVSWTPVTIGLYAMQVRVSDPQGAFTVADFLMQVKDAVGQPPVVNINGLAAPQTATTVRGVPFTFTVSATDPENKPVMLSAASLPNGSTMTPSLPLTAVNPSSTFTWTPPVNGLGTYVMSFAGLDGDGRQDSNTMVLTVTNNPPTIACAVNGPLLEATGPGGAQFGIFATVNDADADKVTVAFFVDGIQRQISGLLTPPATQNYGAPFALGHHSYEGRVGDGLSNVSCAGAFDIVDTTAPSILVTPGDQTLTATYPAGAVATFTVTAHDDVDLTPTVSCSQASGSVFAIGPTVVTCKATDDSGNHNDTSFTITVTDPTPPVVTPRVTGTLGNNGWYTSDISVAWTMVDAESGIMSSTGCENQLVNADTAGVTFTCAATNGSGVSSDPVSVTVRRDATAPILTFTPASITAEATNPTGALVNFTPASAADALSGVASAVSCTRVPGSTFALGTSPVSCSASDAAGNSGSAILAITVADTTAPMVSGHANETANATSAAGAIVTYVAPTTLDMVDGIGTATCLPASGSIFAIGVTTVTCSATDAHGNHAIGTTFTETVVDTPPVIDAHANLSAEATSASGAAVTYLAPVSHDVVDGTTPVSCSPVSGSTFAIGATTVTCSSSDTAGNHAAPVSFTVTVADTTGPAIEAHADLSVPATSASGAVVLYTSPATHDAVDGDGVASCTLPSGSTFALGTTTVTCSAADAHGNHAVSTTFTVAVTNNAPTFTPPANISLPATSAAGAIATFTAVGNDVEDGPIPAVCNATSGLTFPISTTTVNCTVTDVAGATATGSFTVTVTNNAPTFTPPANITLTATSPAGAPALFTAVGHDLEDGTIPAVCNATSGLTFPISTTTVDCTVTDAAGATVSGSFTVTVTNTAPTFTPPANISVPATSDIGAVVLFTAVGHDLEDGTIPAVCNATSGLTFPISTTTVDCTVTDVAGVAVTGSFTVTVTNNAPTFTPPANISLSATSAAGAIASFSAVGNDVEDGMIPVVCTPTSGSTFPIATTTVNCTVTDHAGATATGAFTVTVTNNAPTFAPPANISLSATGASGAIASFTLVGNDLEDGMIPAVCTPASGSTFAIGATTVHCTVTDQAAATATGSFTVTVTNNAPTFTPPVSITTEATGPAGAVASFTANGSDIESGTLAASCSPASGSTFAVGTTPVTCTVTDGAGLTASGAFSVTVIDHTAPVLHVPADVLVHSSSAAGAVVTYVATATDIVDVTVPVVCSAASGSTFAIGITTVTCTATDAHGNVSSGLFHVAVTNAAPVAVNNAYSGQWNTLLTIAAKGVLTNDTDADGDVLSAVLGTGPTHGVLTLNVNGGFTYMPAANYYGPDSFTYRAGDGHGGTSALATVALTITTTCPLIADRDRGHDRDHDFGRDQDHDWSHDWSDDDDDARSCSRGTPVAQNDTYYTKQATTLTVPVKGVLINDGRYAVAASLITAPVHGTVTLNANGSFVYVPAADFFGIDTFVYVARNSAGVAGPVATARIIVKKNLAPDADNDYYSTKRNTTLTVSSGNGVLEGDSDPNGDAITAVLVTSPAHGTLTMTATGSFVYKPATNFSGTDTFTYKAKDPLGLTDTATVTIRVNVSGGHDDGHESHHHDNDNCDHEQHRNGHFDGDGCEHDRQHG